MRNPLLDPNARLVIAHRGNRVGAPENTVESLRQAVSLGADAIEFDVRATKDGTPVVIHDATMDRTTNVTGTVAELTLDQVQAADASARSPHATGAPMTVPALSEVLECFRDIPMVIEVKEIGAVDSTERMIRRFGVESRVIIGSTSVDVIERFYRSGLATCASMLDAILLIPFALVGLTPPRPRYDLLSVTPTFHGIPIPVKRLAAAGRRMGMATQVWTINDPGTAKAYWAAGIAGIVTDDPAAILRARSQ